MLKPPAFASRDPTGTASTPRSNQSAGNGARAERKKGAKGECARFSEEEICLVSFSGDGMDGRGVDARGGGWIRTRDRAPRRNCQMFLAIFIHFLYGVDLRI